MAKKCQELEGELEELKARIRALSLAQAEDVDAPPPETAEVHATPLPGPLDFEELVDVLKQEVEDMHPLTCLAIFGLGVLTGRLLAH